jgi:hypothetical protein
LAYCVPLGIPHSRFLSWPPDDQDKALAYMRAKAELCPACGTREAEWQEDFDAYIADVERCKGCERLEMTRAEVQQAGDVAGKGIKVVLRRPDWDADLESEGNVPWKNDEVDPVVVTGGLV